jgi:Mlc titration factor MtfA (ptsG expression regulator)
LGTITIFIIIFLWAYIRYFYLAKPDATDDNYDVTDSDFYAFNQFYENQFPYFQKLDAVGKVKFVERSIELSRSIEIQTREELEYTQEMDIFISGCLAQLTYGFKNPHIEMLKGVVVYPDVFYSRLIENWVKGLAMGNGVVFISWPHFVQGYEDSRDTYNLGLHEFAHMLRMQTFSDGNLDTKFSNYFDEYNEIAMMSFISHRNGSDNFFRSYGSTNEAEFFSVCIENFFEIPDLFEAELPTLYYHLCYLLNQNPLNVNENYSFNREDIHNANKEVKAPIPEFEHIFSNQEKMFWDFGTVIINFIFFAGVLIAFSLKQYIFLIDILGILIVISAILLAVRYWYYNNLECITNTNYLGHFFKRVLPLLGILSCVLNLILA